MAWPGSRPIAAGRGCPKRQSMIASVRGVVLSAGLDSAVIEVGGVGLLLHTTAATAASLRPGAEASLATTLVVREESLTLYGFALQDERAVFNLVQTVPGVGPRLALAMLAIHAPDHWGWRSRRADQGPRDRQEGSRAHHLGASRQDRCSVRRRVVRDEAACGRRGECTGARCACRPWLVVPAGRGGG